MSRALLDLPAGSASAPHQELLGQWQCCLGTCPVLQLSAPCSASTQLQPRVWWKGTALTALSCTGTKGFINHTSMFSLGSCLGTGLAPCHFSHHVWQRGASDCQATAGLPLSTLAGTELFTLPWLAAGHKLLPPPCLQLPGQEWHSQEGSLQVLGCWRVCTV